MAPNFPSVPGDPAAMRNKARALRAEAERISEHVGRVRGEVHGVEFEGPAARRFRGRMSGWEARVKAIVEELESLAALLLRSAAQVEDDQREAAQRREQAERARRRG